MTTTTETTPDVSAARWALDPAHSSIWFSGRQLGISTVRGWFRRFTVELAVEDERPESAQVVATIDAASLETGEAGRDAHLRSGDFLDAEQHPELTFRSTGVVPVDDDRLRLDGELTIKGVARPVSLDVAFHGFGSGMAGERRVAFTATTSLDRTGWGLTWNMPFGETLLVSREIQLVIDVSFAETPEAASAMAA